MTSQNTSSKTLSCSLSQTAALAWLVSFPIPLPGRKGANQRGARCFAQGEKNHVASAASRIPFASSNGEFMFAIAEGLEHVADRHACRCGNKKLSSAMKTLHYYPRFAIEV
ncbi:uncharacterized protein PV07_10891 [Cladophialophora immunda]|uniref:Uncharacterized protein n=1 Tax=Cladophialophora immunda TaxID=569365 RepID=A0A0D1Z4T4_9EURO|nr:uncharacterized protein PV07_10891 [Cladophialophora immunda]KIW22611.1 hypothetical protein PV07_10891 [Cladophialophora immunda]